MSEKQSKFDEKWNHPTVKRVIGAAYSVGAAIVIIGALFKIQHWEGAGLMLTIGMGTEAFLFALGAFDKPHKEYNWDNIFNFTSGNYAINGDQIGQTVGPTVATSVALPQTDFSSAIDENEMKALSDSIKNLNTTAQQLNGLANVAASTDKLSKNLDEASIAAGKFISTQDNLNMAANQLNGSYKGITDGMQAVENNTKIYASNIEDINKNLSSINSIYEIQLKNIQTQSEGLNRQSEVLKVVTRDIEGVNAEVDKMKLAAVVAAQQAELFKAGTEKLSKQVGDLNQIYGNMLNALS